MDVHDTNRQTVEVRLGYPQEIVAFDPKIHIMLVLDEQGVPVLFWLLSGP